MISQTGKKNKNFLVRIAFRIAPKNTRYAIPSFARTGEARPNRQGGFTLLELTLVAVIILILVCISVPLFKRTYQDLRLTSSAKEIASVMQFCRERAVFERKNFRFKVDPDKKAYQLFAEDEDKGKFLPLRSRWGRAFKIPDGIDIETDQDTVDFFPDGTASPASLYLTNKESQVFTILIEQDTGLVRVYDYKKQ